MCNLVTESALSDGIVVQTKVDDGSGRNYANLVRHGGLWFVRMRLCRFIIHRLIGDIREEYKYEFKNQKEETL